MPQANESGDHRAVKRRNDIVVMACAVFVAAMVGLSFAAVPLYRMFCQVTGFGGEPGLANAAPGRVAGPSFTVRFDTNVAPGLPWYFEPEQRRVTVHPGEQTLVYFKAVNRSGKDLWGAATYNVQPDLVGKYFKKIQCFCFDEQELTAGQSADMPVTFFVDPAILKDPELNNMRQITLSYTFFPAEPETTSDQSPKTRTN